jgi:hypothetical protein
MLRVGGIPIGPDERAGAHVRQPGWDPQGLVDLASQHGATDGVVDAAQHQAGVGRLGGHAATRPRA